MKSLLSTLLSLFFVAAISLAESLPHPIIWVTAEERDSIQAKIDQHAWAANLYEQYRISISATKTLHKINPGLTLRKIPDLGDNLSGHTGILDIGLRAGFIYYFTGDEEAAQISADILAAYAARIADKTPTTLSIASDAFYDARTTIPRIALIYDFVHPFLVKEGTSVYDLATESRRPFDNEEAQMMLWNLAAYALQEYTGPDTHGRVVSNHPILTAPGALYPILCLEDEAERARMFHVFWEVGTWKQNSFKNTILPLYTDQGLWPEALSYSFMPLTLTIINIIDRIYPDLGATDNAMRIMEGAFLFPNLKSPDGIYVRYGDSKRYNDYSDRLLRSIIHISERRGFGEMQHNAEIILKKQRDDVGGYNPQISNGTYDNTNPLELFWGKDLGDSVVGRYDFKPTVIVEHAGVVLQRNWVEQDNDLYGLNGIIGGAHYVHSHCTGISMELYGAGYVMAPNAGLAETLAERNSPEHIEYYRLHAGNNTVIVNGTSHGIQPGSWKGNAYLWQDTAVNIAAEPFHLEDPVSNNMSFATQRLDDSINKAEQERTLAIIRTSPKTGFYFDMVRSRSLVENNFHDYVYHNVGDETLISNSGGTPLSLSPTDRYNNDIGDPVKSPGWRFFKEERASVATNEATRVQFNVNYDSRSMHMFIPDGVEREYTHALAPPTREARNGYVDKDTQVVAIRQYGEAWERPFIAILEPSSTLESSVQSVTQLVQGGKVVGAKVISVADGQSITNYIICQDHPDAVFEDRELGLSFTGRFGVVTDRGGDDVELYIGEGSFLTYGSHLLSSSSGTPTAAYSHFQRDKAPQVNAHGPIHVSSRDHAQLFASMNEDKVVLSWPGIGMKLQHLENNWPDGNWADSPDADQRPVVKAVGETKRLFFRLVKN